MSTTIAQIQIRAGTSAAWASANPVLLSGEPGLATDTGVLKFGDGATQWASLPAFAVKTPPADGNPYVYEDGAWTVLAITDTDLAADVTGVLPEANGGTGQSSLAGVMNALTGVGDYPASEALLSGDFVNVWNDSGTLKIRKADASAEATMAHGYVKSAAALGDDVTLYALDGSVLSGLTGLTLGAAYYLSDTAGEVSTTPGTVYQRVGVAITTSSLLVRIGGAYA